MSSDGTSSSGSRIRQFGLYSNIDARTEEFLRLSRKRQIRQGCACAAASTAITVTVAIVVFFVYEFSLNSETNLGSSPKSNWLSLMNNAPENYSFDSKLTNANIDMTTLKLLPLLIKAIKKNAFLEKLLEDHLSSSPSYNKKETEEPTEDYLEPNTFSNTWFKIPTTKLFAIEYKTSPVVYFKHPTKNIENYSKIRKIRDHQRVFNYVDKMISEKVNIRSTRPVLMEKTRTEIPAIKKILTHKKISPQKSTLAKHVASITSKSNKSEKAPFRCNCSEKLGKLLTKILLSIQKLLPEINSKATKLLKCVNKEPSLLINNITVVKSPGYNISSLITTLKPVTSAATENVTSIPGNYTKNVRIVTFKPNTATEAFNHFDMVSPSTVKLYDQTTLKKEIFTLSSDLQIISPTTRKPAKFVNRYKNIMNRKQILRKPKLRFENTVYEPIFDGIEYDDYSYITPASKIISILNKNKIDFIQTKLKYLYNVKSVKKNMKSEFKIPEIYKKINKSIFKPRKSTDINVVDNKIALVKAKSLKINKVSKKSKQNYTNTISKTLKKVGVTGTPLTVTPDYYNNISNDLKAVGITGTPLTVTPTFKVVKDKRKLDLFNSSLANSSEILTKVVTKLNRNDLQVAQETTDLVTPTTSYFSLLRNPKVNETMYQSVKNVNKTSFLSNSVTTPKSVSVKIALINKINTTSDEQRNLEPLQLKETKKNIYQMIQNSVKSLLKPKSYPINQSASLLLPLSSTSGISKERKNHATGLFEEGHELLFKDLAEITKNNIDETENKPKYEQENITENKLRNYSYPLRNEDYAFTWDDPTYDVIITWPPTTSKQQYLEFQKTDKKHEEHFQDNFKTNFYDLTV